MPSIPSRAPTVGPPIVRDQTIMHAHRPQPGCWEGVFRPCAIRPPATLRAFREPGPETRTMSATPAPEPQPLADLSSHDAFVDGVPHRTFEHRNTMSSARIDIEGVSVSPDHYIGGRRISSIRTFDDRSPLDWSLKLGDFARGDAGTAEQAVAAAAAARHIGAAAARNIVPFTAEFGGKSPLIVFADADLDAAARSSRPVRRCRSGLHGRHAPAGRGIDSRRVPGQDARLHR